MKIEQPAQLMVDATESWPEAPYRGLNYYSSRERHLFAGRGRDVEHCARLLSHSDTHAMILHGTTGCGKSSLLRAGLIPFLEQDRRSFQFMRHGETPSALFIRSTDTPLVKIAEAIYRFAEAGVTIETPIGPEPIDTSVAMLGMKDRCAFQARVGTNPELVMESLRRLGDLLPRTLVMIVDQAEEVLTLKPGVAGDIWRQQFFSFLSLLSRSALDIKLIIALRTEYYGRLRHEIQTWNFDLAKLRDYFLSPLRYPDLLASIVLPTSPMAVNGLGSPREKYQFSYAPGVAEQIARDLQNAAPSGGILPVMQIVCGRLFRSTRARNTRPWEITAEDYAKLGGVEGQIEEHVREVLRDGLDEFGGRRCGTAFAARRTLSPPESRWCELLTELVRPQADGTVTTELRTEEYMRKRAHALGCAPLDKMIEYLSDDERRICRRLELPRVQRTLSESAEKPESDSVPCIGLGHDAIGLALLRWKNSGDVRIARFKRMGRLTAIVYGITGGLLFVLEREEVISASIGRYWSFFFGMAGYGLLLSTRSFSKAVVRIMSSSKRKASDSPTKLKQLDPFLWASNYLMRRTSDSPTKLKNSPVAPSPMPVSKLSGPFASEEPPELPQPLDPSDPHKGRWGGKACDAHRVVSAWVTDEPHCPDWFRITLNVSSDHADHPLREKVRFHLHPTCKHAIEDVEVLDGKASLTLVTWGAFTVGIEADDGATRLELDLSELHDVPRGFKNPKSRRR